MSIETKLPPIVEGEPLPKEYWPNVDHLVTEDDEPVDNIYSEKQQRLLTESLYTSWSPGPFVAMANVGLFYQINTVAVVPDVLVSRGVSIFTDPWIKEHRSYLVWMYGKPPDAVIEVVSNQVGGEDTHKQKTYAERGVPYYAIWDPQLLLSEQPLRLLVLHEGSYVPLSGPMLKRLGLGLVVWHGVFEDLEADWLRWRREDGSLLLTGKERAEVERQRADAESQRADEASQRADEASQRADAASQRAEAASQRAERLAAKLRELGVDPNGDRQ